MTACWMLLYAMLRNVWTRCNDRLFVGATVLTIVSTSTAFAISQFSSRYVMAAFPFALIMVQPFFRASKWAALRLIAGSVVGVFCLANYYW